MESREDKDVGLDEPLTQKEMFDYFERIVTYTTDKYVESMKSMNRAMAILTIFWIIMFLIYTLSI